MGRGLHWDPFAHWWGHKNGHNLSQKKRHSNRFLKKFSKREIFLRGVRNIRHWETKGWADHVALICASEQKSYHTRYEYSKSFSRPQLSSIFLPFKQIWLHFELCENIGIKRNQMTCRCHVIDSHQSANHWLEYAFQLHCYKCDFFHSKGNIVHKVDIIYENI